MVSGLPVKAQCNVGCCVPCLVRSSAPRGQHQPVSFAVSQPSTGRAAPGLQVAHEPALAAALSELIDSCKGAELYLRRPERYGLGSSTAHSWAEVSELARLREETALGYIGPDGRLVLVPDSTAAMHYGRDARIVVLSEC